ncbi:TPA: hypothetical protein DEP96_00940 [Candidatus Uhrbacteria bacterium]|nr:hypothetical protein [Candidatus Uhrbacteria bacterium]
MFTVLALLLLVGCLHKMPSVELAAEPVDAETELLAIVERGTKRYGDKPFTVLMVATNSVDAGTDGWRTCSQFEPVELGVPRRTIVEKFDESKRECGDHPGDYVVLVLLVGPVGLEKKLVDPVYHGEKMTITLVGGFIINTE